MPDLPALFERQALESFDGWEADALLDWLRSATDRQVLAEKWADAHRLNVGKALVLLRDRLAEGQYGKAVADLASGAGVTPRTLGNWRAAFEATKVLPPPKKAAKRSGAQKKRRTDETFHKSGSPKVPIEATAKQVPNANLLVNIDPEPVDIDEQPAAPTGPVKPVPPPAPPPDPPPSTSPKKRGKLTISSASTGLSVGRGDDVALTLTDDEARELLAAIRKHLSSRNTTTDPGACKHEKKVQHSWGTVCANCGKRV